VIFVTWEGLFVARAFDGRALDFFGSTKFNDFFFNLIEIILVHAKTLHNH
jgi:hypothetical protein